MNEEQITLGILEILNNYAETHGVGHFGLSDQQVYRHFKLVEEVTINNIIDDLEYQKFIIVYRSLGHHFSSVAITPKGRRFLKHPPLPVPFQNAGIVVAGDHNVVDSNVVMYNNSVQFPANSPALDSEVIALLQQLVEAWNDNSNKKEPSNRFKELAGKLLTFLSAETSGFALQFLLTSILRGYGINI